jgi:hypothetical protein
MPSGSGTKKDAFANSGTANSLSASSNNNANALYGTLAPELQNEMINPQGFSPTEKAAMNTSSQQSVGGSMAGALGQGALEGARTGNQGASTVALDDAARGGQQALSSDALKTEMSDANLKAKQQQEGAQGLGDLYDTNAHDTLGALGLSNQALGVANNAKPTFWQNFAGQATGDALGAITGAK